MANRTIEIIVDVRDQTGGKLGGLKKQLDAFDKQAQRVSNRLKSLSMQKYMATLRLIDNVTAPASRINNLLKKIAGGVYQVTMKVNDAALGGIRKIESALQRISGKVYNVAVNVKGGAMNKLNGLMSGAAMGAGMFMPIAGMAGVGFGVANAIQASAGFEKQMSQVQAIRQLSKDSQEMKALTQQAKDLGMTTAWTRQQVGEAMYYQALAGWDTKQILKATPHLLNLASAGGTDLGRTSDIVTDSMTAFGLNATEDYVNKQGKTVNAVEHFADMLAKLQASSNTDISQAGEAFKYSANVIGAMFSGQDISKRMQATEDAMIMTGLMANAGIKGSMAGTSTRAIFTRMASMNRNSYQALRALGVEYQDENGNILMPGEIMRGMSKRFKEGVDPNQLLDFAETIAGEKIHADTRRKLDSFIEQTMKNGGKMSSADMAKMSAMLAGQEAMSGLLAVLMGDWDAMAEKLDNVGGTAEKMSKDMLDNLAGSFTMLGSAWDAFQQDLFTGTAGNSLRGLVDSLTEILTRANKLFQDGIDIGDFGKIAADVIDRLKNKFLELNGVGSLLAGGALVAGLMKIISLSQRAFTALKTITQPGAWSTVATKGAAGAGAAAGAKVGTMTVSAGVVNVNGKVAGGGAGGAGGAGGRRVGNTTIIDNYNRTKEHVNAQAAMRSNAIKAGIGGAAFAGIFGAFDMMNVRAANAERLAAAAPEERATIIKENRRAEMEAGGGVLGSIVGSAIGAGLGSFAGPLGTAIGGVVGGMLGDVVGRIFGKEVADGTKNPVNESNRWDLNKGSSTDIARSGTDAPEVFDAKVKALSERVVKIWNGTLEEETKVADIGGRIAQRRRAQAETLMEQYQAEQKVLTAQRDQTVRWMNMRKNIESDIGQAINEQKFLQGSTNVDFFKQQRDQMAELSKQNYGAQFSEMLSNLFSIGKRAEAAELTPEQMAQQAAMERGEPVTIPAPTIEPLETSPVDAWFNLDEITARVSEIGTSITEGLSVAFESASEVFANFGTTITEGLTSAMEGAGEIFNGLGETIGAAMDTASSMATSALNAIQSAFTSAKDTVQAAWGELPGFFSGVFSGLGGAAEAAGSAIYSGLTSIIGSIIGAWQSAASTISGIISSIASMASSAGSAVGGVVASVIPGHAEGGFITSPEIAMLGEGGKPELVLPLADKERSLDLLRQASGVLGLNSESDGYSISGGNGGENSSGGITVNVGGISFEVSANSPQELMDGIQGNIQEVADKIAAQLSEALATVHKNQTLVA